MRILGIITTLFVFAVAGVKWIDISSLEDRKSSAEHTHPTGVASNDTTKQSRSSQIGIAQVTEYNRLTPIQSGGKSDSAAIEHPLTKFGELERRKSILATVPRLAVETDREALEEADNEGVRFDITMRPEHRDADYQALGYTSEEEMERDMRHRLGIPDEHALSIFEEEINGETVVSFAVEIPEDDLGQ